MYLQKYPLFAILLDEKFIGLGLNIHNPLTINNLCKNPLKPYKSNIQYISTL